MKLHSQDVRGLSTPWLEGGNSNGPLMVFFHGFPDTPDCWEHQFGAFGDRFLLVAPFSRGTLPSQKAKRWQRYSPVAQSLDALQIVNDKLEMRSRRLVIISHDAGAATAYRFAELVQDRLEAMIVINGLSERQLMNSYLTSWRQTMKSWPLAALQIPSVATTVLPRMPSQFRTALQNIGGLEASKRPPLRLSAGAIVNPAKVFRAIWATGLSTFVRPRERLDTRALAIWGAGQAVFDCPSAEEWKETFNSHQIRYVSGNHWVHREDPELVNRLIDDFVMGRGAGDA